MLELIEERGGQCRIHTVELEQELKATDYPSDSMHGDGDVGNGRELGATDCTSGIEVTMPSNLLTSPTRAIGWQVTRAGLCTIRRLVPV